ncbi:putative WD40 repeat-like protein [Lyophyllum shimeji]|uniref:WD40 repeat-like protein n=1 Tax=Lyophyllum shimeji TaxID=47721 RepID=A0A9P3PCM0_LYOSH|nr:putative WD40 repeat-like protein [Lyophyllum shimeji]
MATSRLLESPQFKTCRSPLKNAQPASAYILSIVSLLGHYAASESAPSNQIGILDKSTLRRIGNLSGHEVATTSLKAVDNIIGIAGRTLMSSGKDGSVKIWDPRSNSHSIKMTNLGASRSLLCCDVSPDGLTVAAGTDMQGEDALIFYWDPRQPAAPLRTHGSTHSDDITTVSFAPQESGMPRNTLLSASTDGLICTSNADQADEDEAVLFVGNWGASVSQAGWNDASSGPKIWAASDMETFSTWTHELDLCQSLDIRSPVLHGKHTWVTDYLITCASNPNTPGSLGVFVGSNEGDVALLSNADLSVSDATWCLHNVWSAGHVGVVRSLLWDHESNVLVTGGEDAKINVWPTLSPEHQLDEESMDVDSTTSRKRSRDRDEEQEGKRARR